MKMLATGSALADEIWIGNILPLSPEPEDGGDHLRGAVQRQGRVAVVAQAVRTRRPHSEFEAPLTWRFDEADAMVMFDNVKVPWERVFVHDDPALSRGLYIETAAHSYGNHHSNVRLLVKMQFLVGLASRIAQANGAAEVPAVRETLGRLAGARSAAGGARSRARSRPARNGRCRAMSPSTAA